MQEVGQMDEGGGHVMKMNFNIDLPMGKMLFVNWEVDDQKDLAWVSLHNAPKKCFFSDTIFDYISLDLRCTRASLLCI